jgi:prevent-host-death family protein
MGASCNTNRSLTNLTNPKDDGNVVVMTLNLYDAKTQLSALVDKAADGEEIVIAKNGKPMAKLVAFKAAVKRKPGRLKGKIWMSDDFDAPMTPEEIAAWEGNESDAELF